MNALAHDIMSRLDLIRQTESLRSQLARCAAARANLEQRILELTHERDAKQYEANLLRDLLIINGIIIPVKLR
jgi:hypothetical protein